MAFTIDSAQKLTEAARLFEEMKRKDIFSSAGETFAAVGDVLGGRATASSLIQKYGETMTRAEKEKARNDLLGTLADYQKSRREDLRVRDKDRLDFLKEQYGNVTGERRWAMEQVVALEKQQMQGQSQVTSARLNQLAAEMRDSDRQLERGGFREATNDNERRSMIDAGTLVRVDDYVAALQNMRVPGQSLDAGIIAQQFEGIVGSVPAGQAEHVMNLLDNVLPNDFENAMVASLDDPSIRDQYAAFRNTVQRGMQERVRHDQQRDDWEEKRQQVWRTFERQGGARANPALVTELKNIFNESPEETTARVNEMMASLPESVTQPAEERELGEDAFTRNIQAQLDRLDDPRFLFSGSRHERLKQEIMRSPEFQQYMAEKGEGGMINPDQAFRMMLKETKDGLLIGNQNAQSVAGADARSMGSPFVDSLSGRAEMKAQGGAHGFFPEFTNKGRRVNTTPLDPSRPITETARDTASAAMDRFRTRASTLSQRLQDPAGGPRRKMLRGLARDTMTNADGLRDSALQASQSAQSVGRLRARLKEQADE
jgi:hypothetical protein